MTVNNIPLIVKALELEPLKKIIKTLDLPKDSEIVDLGDFLLDRENQPEFMDDIDWREEFELD